MKFSFLTFDCYGTLIDWRNGLEANLGDLLRSKGLRKDVAVYPTYINLEAEQEGTYKPYRQVLRDTAIAVAKQLQLQLTEEEAEEFAKSIPTWRPFTDTVKVLKELGQRGCKRVILSNIDRDLLQNTITRHGLAVDGFITAEDVGSYKPVLGHWNRFFDEYNAKREETLHVAQSIYHDIIPSGKVGVANAWINRYGDPKPEGVDPRYEFTGLEGLLTLA